MSLQLWLAYVAAASIILIIPGPTIITVLGYSLAHGRRATLPLVGAVALGDTTALLLSLTGLGVLISVSEIAFNVLKWVGGIYLIVLGLRMWIGSTTVKSKAMDVKLPMTRLVVNTWLVTAINPKGIVFFLAFLPQFVNTQQPILFQLFVLSATFVVLAAFNAFLYAWFAARLRVNLGNSRWQRVFGRVGGSLLIGAGLWSLTARRVTL